MDDLSRYQDKTDREDPYTEGGERSSEHHQVDRVNRQLMSMSRPRPLWPKLVRLSRILVGLHGAVKELGQEAYPISMSRHATITASGRITQIDDGDRL